MRRWSNQCAVDSCSARKRVIGGSPRSAGSAAHVASTTAPAARARPAGTERRGGATPAARQIAATSSATGRGSPLVTTRARPSSSTHRSTAATSASAALVT